MSQIDCFQDDVIKVIDSYHQKGVKLGEVIGALEIIKLDLY